jgi:membrane-anchored glycerophosphoryl diester phosphodiesterase (GDPDase)
VKFFVQIIIAAIVLFVIVIYGVELGINNALVWYDEEKRKSIKSKKVFGELLVHTKNMVCKKLS